MGEPPLLGDQGVRQGVGQGSACNLVKAVRGCEADPGLRQGVELLQCLPAPLATALTRLPAFQEARAARAQEGRGRWMGRQET